MTITQRHIMVMVLLIATILVILNIVAVTTGHAEDYYSYVKEWFESSLGTHRLR